MTRDELQQHLDEWMDKQTTDHFQPTKAEFVGEIQVAQPNCATAQARSYLRLTTSKKKGTAHSFRVDGETLLDVLAMILVDDETA